MKKQNILSKIGITIILIYILVRVSSFWNVKAGLVTTFFMILFFIAEIFIAIHTMGFLLSIRRIAKQQLPDTGTLQPAVIQNRGNWPSVAVTVAARHESSHILENTFTTLKNLNYPNMTLYFLDDSSDEPYKAEAAVIADHYGARLFRREERHGVV